MKTEITNLWADLDDEYHDTSCLVAELEHNLSRFGEEKLDTASKALMTIDTHNNRLKLFLEGFRVEMTKTLDASETTLFSDRRFWLKNSRH